MATNEFFGEQLNLSPTNFLKHYSMQLGSLAIAYKFFDFSSFSYFALNIILRIIAAFVIFFFVTKWTKSRLAGFLSSLFFGINTAGIRSTVDVTLFQVYIAITFLIIFLDRWLAFHNHPNRRNLIVSTALFVITILSYPERMVGLPFLVVAAELYWLFKSFKDKMNRTLVLFHLLSLIFILILLIFITGSLSPIGEVAAKQVSIGVLLLSLLIGSPDTIAAIFAFIGNLLIPSPPLNSNYLDIQIIKSLGDLIPILGIIFVIISLIKRKFLLAYLWVIPIVFSPFISQSKLELVGWQEDWIAVTRLGGTLFTILNLALISLWQKNKTLSGIGLLGTGLVLSNLLLPWLISPQNNSASDQSAFRFVHRYYTVPSIGMGLLLSCAVSLILQSFKKNLLMRSMLVLLIIVPTALLILLQVVATRHYIMAQDKYINLNDANAQKIDLFWTKLRPFVKNIKGGEDNLIYIDSDGSLSERYITAYFPVRIDMTTKGDSPKLKFIFQESELDQYLMQHPDNQTLETALFAFSWHNNNLKDIKNELLNSYDQSL